MPENPTEELYKIWNVSDGMIDFKQNASDTSRIVFKCCLKSEKLCIAFALFLFDPDEQCPKQERWAVASFLPIDKDMPQDLKSKMQRSIDYIGEQVKRIWTGYSVQPLSTKDQ